MATAKSKQPKNSAKSVTLKKRVPSKFALAVRRFFFKPATLIVSAFLVSMAVMIPYIPHLLPDLSQQPEYQFPMDQIQVNTPNDWIPASLLSDVLKQSELPASVSLLQPDLCRKVAMAFEAHPWVKKVESVRITGEPALRAVLEYRTPVAFIETTSGLYPVDVEGVILPPVDFAMSDTQRLPRVKNIRSQPTAGVGNPWNDEVVKAGAVLAARLTPNQNMDRYWNRYQIKSIVAPTIDETQLASKPITRDDMTFELATTGGSRIVWGKPPGADDLEPTVEQKIGRLEQYVSRFGSFDAPSGPYRIDIRQFDSIGLETLGEQVYR